MYIRAFSLFSVVLLIASCSSSSGSVTQKVLHDFGLGEAPEGYESVTSRVFENLRDVGASEMQRLNLRERRGTIQFDESGGLHGKYYKELKVYERAIPLDAQATGRTAASRSERGFVGYIEYPFRIYRGPMRATRVEASAEKAIIPTDEHGRENYRYRFNSSGNWNGGQGELVRK